VPLLTWADTQTAAASGGKVWEQMKRLVGAGAMPPAATPTGALTADEKATLMGWLGAGAPSDTRACESSPPRTPASPGVGTAPTGAAALPCQPSHEFRAYGGRPDQPYAVPIADDHYRCFAFQTPFQAGEQATAWAPIIDDERVVHHWILYANSGTTMPADCRDSRRTHLMGWAPGGHNYVMPADVGLDLPEPGTWMTLEVHYNNKARHADARDRSGVAVCTTRTPRPMEAGIFTLGSLRISIPPGADGHVVTGECSALATRLLPEPLSVLSSWPHMHQLGTTFRTEIVRDGVTHTLVDVPRWDFHNQVSYPHDPATTQIRPGDALRTTCVYRNPSGSTVRFGGGTSDEMCLNFVMAYPVRPSVRRECIGF
jgi:hypothetical protein